MSTQTVIALAFTLLVGCAASPPCSRAELAKTSAECMARVKLLCAKGDKACPAYVECKQRIENWRVCK